MKFVATFTPGFSEVIARILKRYPVEKLRITHIEDGLVAGETTLEVSKLSSMRFWHNVFVAAVVTEAEQVNNLPFYLKKRDLQQLLLYQPDAHTIWVRALEHSQPARLSPKSHSPLLALLKEVGVTPATHHPDAELWLVHRASNFSFVGLRVPSPRFKRRPRAAGELRPELAHTLGLVAGISSKDVVLDPFAGYGAIPRELIAGFSPKKVIALDSNPRLVGNLQALAKEKSSLKVIVGDALHMTAIADQSVTRIVTDPPWGDYQLQSQPLDQFYGQLLKECARVLTAGGVAVILSGAKAALLAVIAMQKDLELVKTYPILVSGKKAVVTKLRKR